MSVLCVGWNALMIVPYLSSIIFLIILFYSDPVFSLFWSSDFWRSDPACKPYTSDVWDALLIFAFASDPVTIHQKLKKKSDPASYWPADPDLPALIIWSFDHPNLCVRCLLFIEDKCALSADSFSLQLSFFFDSLESHLTEVFSTGNIYPATCIEKIMWHYVHWYRPPILTDFYCL